jgi:mannosyltransferase
MRKRLCAVPPRIWLILIIILATVLRLFHLGYQSLWFDEARSFTRASMSLPETLRQTLIAVHPPLYSFTLHFWLKVGHSETLLRFPSVAFGVLALPLIYQLGRLCMGRRTGLMAALLLALNPFHVWYAQETRMYSMLMLLTLSAAYFFLRVVRDNSRRSWNGLVVSCALAYYAHYFAFFIPLIQFTFFLCTLRTHHRLFRKWVLSQIIAALPLAPWLVAYYALASHSLQGVGHGLIPKPGLLAPVETLWKFSLGSTDTLTPVLTLILAAFGLVLFLGVKSSGRTESPHFRLFTLLWLGVPILFTFLLALRRSFYLDRCFIIVLPAYLILLAMGIVGIGKPLIRWGLTSVIILAMTFGLRQLYFAPLFFKEDWRAATSYIQSQYRDGDIIVSRYVQDGAPLFYYYQGNPDWATLSVEEITMPLEFVTRHHQRLWLVYYRPRMYAAGHSISRLDAFSLEEEPAPFIREWLVANQNNLLADRNFPGIYVALYRILLESEP